MRHPANWLLIFGVPKHDRPALLGDLAETYQCQIRPHRSWIGAQTWYVGQLFAAIGFALVARVREAAQAIAGFRIESLWLDLRGSIRLLTHARLFSASVIVLLALGIGANTAVFTVINAVLIRPLPFPRPGELVMVWETEARTHTTEGLASSASWTGRPAQPI